MIFKRKKIWSYLVLQINSLNVLVIAEIYTN